MREFTFFKKISEKCFGDNAQTDSETATTTDGCYNNRRLLQQQMAATTTDGRYNNRRLLQQQTAATTDGRYNNRRLLQQQSATPTDSCYNNRRPLQQMATTTTDGCYYNRRPQQQMAATTTDGCYYNRRLLQQQTATTKQKYDKEDTYTPQISIPDAKVSDEIWRLETLLDEEDRSVFVTTCWVSFNVVLSTPD